MNKRFSKTARRFIFIVNPIAGTRNKQDLKEIITATFNEAGVPFDIFPSVANGDYSFLEPIIHENNYSAIIIAGGDGTINQVIASLRHLNLPFGLIPCGSGNGLALSAGIPKNPKKALRLILQGTPHLTDAFFINHKFACMLCGLGLDAKVAHDFAKDPRRGLTTYIKKTIKNFLKADAYSFLIEAEGQEVQADAHFISIANSNQFGNNFTIAPEASLHDGLLDIVVMAKQSKLSMLYQSMRQVAGFNKVQEAALLNHEASVLYFQTPLLRVQNESSAPMHIDGDPVETERILEFSIIRDAYWLICPSAE